MTPNPANTLHTIQITITSEGKIVGEVKGVQGPHCAPLSAWLDELGKVVEDRSTPDYHRRGSQTVQTGR